MRKFTGILCASRNRLEFLRKLRRSIGTHADIALSNRLEVRANRRPTSPAARASSRQPSPDSGLARGRSRRGARRPSRSSREARAKAGWEAGIRTAVTWSREQITDFGGFRSASFLAVFVPPLWYASLAFAAFPCNLSRCVSRCNLHSRPGRPDAGRASLGFSPRPAASRMVRASSRPSRRSPAVGNESSVFLRSRVRDAVVLRTELY
jgi:hypothetical protein